MVDHSPGAGKKVIGIRRVRGEDATDRASHLVQSAVIELCETLFSDSQEKYGPDILFLALTNIAALMAAHSPDPAQPAEVFAHIAEQLRDDPGFFTETRTVS